MHPTKAWVRFRAPRQIQEMLYRAVHDALRQQQVMAAQRGLETVRSDAATGALDGDGLTAPERLSAEWGSAGAN